MVFHVYEQGLRIATPWYDIFPPRNVGKADPISPPPALSASDQVKERGLPHTTPELRTYRDIGQGEKKRKPVRFAAQLMTAPVVTLTLDADLHNTWQLFSERRFRHVPVVNAEGRLCGIVSDRDLLTATSRLVKGREQVDTAKTVKDIMASPALTAFPATEIRLVAEVMISRRIGAIPLVDEEETLVGIVTRSDILKALMHQAPLELWT